MGHRRFFFHAEQAPLGKLFTENDADPTEPGWVDTPAKFDAAYVAPPAVDAAAAPGEAPAPTRVHVAYPSIRYNREDGAVKKVLSLEEDRALDARVWKHSPDPATWTEDLPAPTTPPSKTSVADDAAKKAELFAMNVGKVAELVAGQTNVDTLNQIAAFEAENPNGARVTVGKAVKARLAELNAPTE